MIVTLTKIEKIGLLKAVRVTTLKVREKALLITSREIIKITSIKIVVKIFIIRMIKISLKASIDAIEKEKKITNKKSNKKENARASSISISKRAKNLY